MIYTKDQKRGKGSKGEEGQGGEKDQRGEGVQGIPVNGVSNGIREAVKNYLAFCPLRGGVPPFPLSFFEHKIQLKSSFFRSKNSIFCPFSCSFSPFWTIIWPFWPIFNLI